MELVEQKIPDKGYSKCKNPGVALNWSRPVQLYRENNGIRKML
jgi:hypothetical protein